MLLNYHKMASSTKLTRAVHSVLRALPSRFVRSNVYSSAAFIRNFSQDIPKPKSEVVTINFVDREGYKTTVQAKLGENLLDVAKDNDVDLEGACEGTLSCSTCHLIFKPEEIEKLKLPEPLDEELDMLDLAYGLTDTSRLGCQVIVTKDFEGITLSIPVARDVRTL